MQTDRFYNLFEPRTGSHRLWQRCWVVVGLLVSLWTNVALAHEFEDGHVERAVAVVVRKDVARLEYSIGVNPVTRQQLIDFWESQEKPTQAGDPTNTAETTDDDRFLHLAGINVSRRLSFRVDGTEIEGKLISSAASARHHVDVTVTMEFKIPEAKADELLKLKIVDRNFLPNLSQPVDEDDLSPKAPAPQIATKTAAPESPAASAPVPMSGGFRYALKAKGDVILARSNVASILIRAQRKLDSQRKQLLESDPFSHFTIIADLAIIE